LNKPIIIVSGLPRSGTSMMMKMLEAGGMKVMKDEVRRADEDNPGGYYEFELVKKTREDPSWLENARGKGVKMVSRLLFDLPALHTYKVLFMKRKMEEILASQQRMLERMNNSEELEVSDDVVGSLFQAHLEQIQRWMSGQKNFEVHYVHYNELMNDPVKSLSSIRDFLAIPLDVQVMAGVLDNSLYRQRK